MISNSRRQIDIEAKIPLKDPAFCLISRHAEMHKNGVFDWTHEYFALFNILFCTVAGRFPRFSHQN
jgi:hypothetical protein